jgi:hypothetical protein
MGYGGGMAFESGDLQLTDATVAKNHAKNLGGGLEFSNVSAEIGNSTIAENVAAEGGGVYVDPNFSRTMTFVSTIIGENHAGGAANRDPDVEGTITANDDLIQNEGMDGANITGTNDIVGVSPLFGSLGLHDGGTTETLVPSKLSPAVLNGPGENLYDLMTDQNGQPFGTKVFIGSVQTTS